MSLSLGAPSTAHHRRQRSSVSVKKKRAVHQDSDGHHDLSEVPDNALSANDVTSGGLDIHASLGDGNGSIQAPDRDTQEALRRNDALPHGLQSGIRSEDSTALSAGEQIVESSPPVEGPHFGTKEAVPLDYFALQPAVAASPGSNPRDKTRHMSRDQPTLAQATTRSELDLFEDDEAYDNHVQDLSVPNAPGRSTFAEESSFGPRSTAEPTAPSTTHELHHDTESLAQVVTPKMNNDAPMFPVQTPTGPPSGKKPLSLLSSGSVLNSMGSPTSSSPAAASSSTLTRSARKSHRLSIAYMPSPGKNSFPGTPPVFDDSKPQTPTGQGAEHRGAPTVLRSSSISVKTSEASPPPTATLPKPSDGDTLIAQHKGILEQIAEKERRVLELKDQLTREESDLSSLRKQWQASAHRELAGGSASAQMRGRASNGSAASDSAASSNRGAVETGTNNIVGNDAGETLRNISARFQNGFGTQFNSFLEQLVQVDTPVEDKRTSDRTIASSANTSLGSVIEEAESASTSPTASPSLANPVGNDRALPAASPGMTKQQNKRSSLFGGSFTALQKQLEQQFSATGREGEDKQGPADRLDSSGGWGGLQKRLKDARENASGLLAMAEAKLGQAMTLDDLVSQERHGTVPKDLLAPQTSTSHMHSPSPLETENDREKAALAELSWLNSLMGVQTNGSVDRAVTANTSDATPDRTTVRFGLKKLAGSSTDELHDGLGNHGVQRQTLKEVSPGRKPLPLPNTAEPIPRDREKPGPSHSSRDASKRASGIFDMLSAVWGPEATTSPACEQAYSTNVPDGARTTGKERRVNGQTRTRLAARAALEQGKDLPVPPASGPQEDVDVAAGRTEAYLPSGKANSSSPRNQRTSALLVHSNNTDAFQSADAQEEPYDWGW